MIGTVEQSIIDRLQSLSDSDALGYKLRQIKTYGGELKDQQARVGIKDVPAAWLVFNGADKPTRFSNGNKRVLRFVLLLATQSLRNEQDSRHGDSTGAVGAYQLAEDFDGILTGWRPDGAIQGIETGRIEPLSVESRSNALFAVYGLELFVAIEVPRQAPEIDLTNPLEAIHTNWDLPPHGNVGPELPDDENADATSHVTGDDS